MHLYGAWVFRPLLLYISIFYNDSSRGYGPLE